MGLKVSHFGQAYSSLGSQWLMQGHAHNPVLTAAEVLAIAKKRNTSAAHVALQWAVQHGQVSVTSSNDLHASNPKGPV